jgi:transposase
MTPTSRKTRWPWCRPDAVSPRFAGSLGCSNWSLGRWVAAKKNGGPLTQPKNVAAETPEQREIRRLKQDNDYLRRQRDILKKALAIVSDGNLNSASNS